MMLRNSCACSTRSDHQTRSLERNSRPSGCRQDVTTHLEAGPVRSDQLAAPEHAHELVRGVGDPGSSSFPVGDGAHADAQQSGAVADGQAEGKPGGAEPVSVVLDPQGRWPAAPPFGDVANFA